MAHPLSLLNRPPSCAPNTVAEEVVETVMQVDLRYTQKKTHRTTESKVKIIEGQWVLRNIRGENG